MQDNYDEDDDPFSKALGLSKIPQLPTHTIEHLPDIAPEQKVEIKTYVQNDYDFARKMMRELVMAGAQLFQDSATVARQTGTPEGFVAASQVMKNIIDANEKLLKLSETHAKVTDGKKNEIKQEKQEPTHVENKTIVVTSANMLDFIENAKNGNPTKS